MAFTKRFHLRSLRQARRKIGISTISSLDTTAERLIGGYTTRDHLIIDLDNERSLGKVSRLVRMIQHDYPYLGDCLICQSSGHGYHLIFDNKITWKKILRVARTLAGLGILNRDYIKIRGFREDLTLRVSSVDRGFEKSPAPLPVAIAAPSGVLFHDHLISLTCIQLLYDDPFTTRFSGIANYLKMLSAFRQTGCLTVPIL